MKHQKTIFMDPISINDYFPEGDYKNLIIEESVDTMGNEKNLDNACSYTNDEALDMTKEFLESKLGIGDEMFSFSPNDSTVYQRNYYGGAAYLGVESIMSLSKYKSSNTVLTFIDSSTDLNCIWKNRYKTIFRSSIFRQDIKQLQLLC